MKIRGRLCDRIRHHDFIVECAVLHTVLLYIKVSPRWGCCMIDVLSVARDSCLGLLYIYYTSMYGDCSALTTGLKVPLFLFVSVCLCLLSISLFHLILNLAKPDMYYL